MKNADAARVFDQLDVEGDCWLWTGPDNHGYGVTSVGGRSRRVHRLVWEHLVGPIPADLVIDHLCRNKLCANPDHLEPVTNRENVLRGVGPTARQARQTHCSEGHELAGEPGTRRRCSVCTRRISKERKERVGAEFLAGGTGVNHGTLSGYSLRCRCEPCKQAGRDYHRAYNARRIAGRAAPSAPPDTEETTP